MAVQRQFVTALAFACTQEMKDWVDDVAERYGVSQGEVARRALGAGATATLAWYEANVELAATAERALAARVSA